MTRKAYRRGWDHTKGRGKETTVTCEFCGRQVPKYKCFPVFKGFRINDPLVRKELGNSASFMQSKSYACPACARHRKIVKKKNSRPNNRR